MSTRLSARTALACTLLGVSALTMTACNETSKTSESQAAIDQNKVTGEAMTLASASLDRAYEGTVRALNGLQFKIEKQAKDALKGVFTARTADNKSISIDLTRKSDSITAINVSAGPIEQTLAKTVLRHIQAELK